MELSVIKKIIKKYTALNTSFLTNASIGRRYYYGNTDILYKEKKDKDVNDVLRRADNRVVHNYFKTLVNQKISYAAKTPPVFDVGNEKQNDCITETLGDKYQKNFARLVGDVSKTGRGVIHYWIENDKFRWGVIPAEQVIPVWDNSLDPSLIGALRYYQKLDDNGDNITIYEYWTETECETFARRAQDDIEQGLFYYNAFTTPDTGEPTNYFKHNYGEVPFVFFWNNEDHSSDLVNIKGLLDAYEAVYNNYLNDLEDVQEIILVLQGYGGTDLNEFLNDLKEYKVVSMDGGDSKLDTLSINIPVEARNKILELTKAAIFTEGMGYDPATVDFSNCSGVALRFLYSQLEMKTALLETEFRISMARLIRVILHANGHDNIGVIKQIWKRNAILNDQEISSICQQSMGVISHKTILQNHPFVQDADAELEQIEEEKEKELETYGFGQVEPGGDDDGGDEADE